MATEAQGLKVNDTQEIVSFNIQILELFEFWGIGGVSLFAQLFHQFVYLLAHPYGLLHLDRHGTVIGKL